MMKPLMFTGIAEETDFTTDPRGTQFFLVFNKGELRLPVPVESAVAAMRFFLSPNGVAVQEHGPAPAPHVDPFPTEAPTLPPPQRETGGDGSEVVLVPEDDGVPQF
jgi:hypothetical protein